MAQPASKQETLDHNGLVGLDDFARDVHAFVARVPQAEEWSTRNGRPSATPYTGRVGNAAVRQHELEQQLALPEARGAETWFQWRPLLVLVLAACVGAMGAAALFHDRLAPLLAQGPILRLW